MTPLAISAATLVVALTMTYLFCIRPMRRGHRRIGCDTADRSESPRGEQRAAEISTLRAELADLRAAVVGPAGSQAPAGKDPVTPAHPASR